MADASPAEPNLISDGKRMRPIWRPGDGNGEPSRYLVERSMATIRGHPTWKLFREDIELPIIRGSSQEPPHYVYLDDKACYVIWSSNVYAKEDLRDYWPFDFDHHGHTRTGRKNRGRPAYSDEAETKYATSPLRNKDRWYEYSGEPEVTEYQPLRAKRKSKIQQLVEQEFAQKALLAQEATGSRQDEYSRSSSSTAITTASATINGADVVHSSHPLPPHHMVSGGPKLPLPGSSLLLGTRPIMLNTSHLEDLPPYGTFRTRTVDVASSYDCTSSETSLSNNTQPVQQNPSKRKFIQPFDVSSSDTSSSPPTPKKFNSGEEF
jgi:hypothetical protein